ncbi:glycerol-3-phosphate cytidylyltransferase [Sphaerotilus hippei]|uniref:Glycerol-3-phosphate cytidylyltransferase n=1 Tax=Sphaerotilus hippei TaxID=744406 RepID=A0A318GWT6_9BURK|nr:adenylyltransferase/cytidyltransferase family protein [Sphaerotilus hippei]PXW91924.1 glycerol-3-phosphate cytidylyltransferase [Sphaerotilus hippei]
MSRTIRQAHRPSSNDDAIRSRPTLAITYGTFDLFHVGHVRLFRRIRERFDRLIVAVSTDEFNAGKGKRSIVPFEDRCEVVSACRHVTQVIPETCWEQKARDIASLGVDAFVMGDDWQGHFDELRSLCQVIYLPRTEGVSSSSLKSDTLRLVQPGTPLRSAGLAGGH